MAENKGGSSSRHQEFQISFGMTQPSSSMSKEGGGAYDLGELDQALFLYLDGQDHSSVQEHRQTLNIFPSQPMHVEPFNKGGMSLTTPTASSKRPADQPMDLGNHRSNPSSLLQPIKDSKPAVKKDGSSKRGATTSSTEHEGPKTPDAKLRTDNKEASSE